MDKRAKKTIIAIVLMIVGIAIFIIFDGLDLPSWVKFIGVPFVSWGLTSLILTYKKQK